MAQVFYGQQGDYSFGQSRPTYFDEPTPQTNEPSVTATTPQFSQPAPQQNTQQSELDRIRQEALSIEEQLAQHAANQEDSATDQSFNQPTFQPERSYEDIYGEPVDEDKIRRDTMSMFQQQIDATNQVYDQMLNEARLEGTGRLGSQRAGAARGGLLGSDFAGSQKERVLGHNEGIRRGIQAERQAKIGQILGEVSSSVVNQLREKRQARQQGAENYLDYLARGQERKEANISTAAQALLAQGIDPRTLSEDELGAIANEAGLSTADIINRYNQLSQQQQAAQSEADLETRKTEAEIDKIEADIEQGNIIKLAEGNMLYDTRTGETFKNPKTFAPRSGGSGDGLGGSSEEFRLAREYANTFEGTDEELNAELIQDSDLSDDRREAVIAARSSQQGQEQFLTRDYFENLYSTEQLEKAAADAGFGDMGKGIFNLKDVDTSAYLDSLENTIQAYRDAGFTDAEILEQMQ